MRSAIIKTAILLTVVWLSGCVTLPMPPQQPRIPPTMLEADTINPVTACREFMDKPYYKDCLEYYKEANDWKRDETSKANSSNYRVHENSYNGNMAIPNHPGYYGGIVPFDPGFVYFEAYGPPRIQNHRHFRGGHRHFRGDNRYYRGGHRHYGPGRRW